MKINLFQIYRYTQIPTKKCQNALKMWNVTDKNGVNVT